MNDRPAETSGHGTRGEPARPRFASGLPQREVGPRPRLVVVVAALVYTSAACFAVPTVEAATRQASLRRDLRAALADYAPDYAPEDVATAVTVGLLAVALIGLLLCLIEIVGARSLLARRSSGRSTLLLAAVPHLPAMFVVSAFRSGGTIDLALVVAQAITLLAAVVLSRREPVTAWLDARPAFVLKPLISERKDPADGHEPRP